MIEWQKPEPANPAAGPCIVARLARGWRVDPSGPTLNNLETGASVPVTMIPDNVRIEPRYPELAARKATELSPDDLDLAHYIQFVFQPGTVLAKYLKRIRCLREIEEADIAPVPTLPQGGAD